MDDAGTREALRRLEEAYRRGLERLHRKQELIDLSYAALAGRRLTRRSSWQTSAPDDGGDRAPDAGYRHQESRRQRDGADPDRHQSAPSEGTD
jgi:hypothetical protein